MFGSSKPVVFDPYRRQRSRGRPPRWLVLLLGGALTGAAGVLFVQERWLPPRLTPTASAELRTALQAAEADRTRLQAGLAQATQRLAAAEAAHRKAGDELAGARASAESLRTDLASLIAALPPDPRGGSVEVRSGRFSAEAGKLDYDVVLTRARASKPMDGVMQLVVSGESTGGRETTVRLAPVSLSVGTHEVVRGSAPLPSGFTPRRTTIQVLDRVAGRSLGMRVMLVQ